LPSAIALCLYTIYMASGSALFSLFTLCTTPQYDIWICLYLLLFSNGPTPSCWYLPFSPFRVLFFFVRYVYFFNRESLLFTYLLLLMGIYVLHFFEIIYMYILCIWIWTQKIWEHPLVARLHLRVHVFCVGIYYIENYIENNYKKMWYDTCHSDEYVFSWFLIFFGTHNTNVAFLCAPLDLKSNTCIFLSFPLIICMC